MQLLTCHSGSHPIHDFTSHKHRVFKETIYEHDQQNKPNKLLLQEWACTKLLLQRLSLRNRPEPPPRAHCLEEVASSTLRHSVVLEDTQAVHNSECGRTVCSDPVPQEEASAARNRNTPLASTEEVIGNEGRKASCLDENIAVDVVYNSVLLEGGAAFVRHDDTSAAVAFDEVPHNEGPSTATSNMNTLLVSARGCKGSLRQGAYPVRWTPTHSGRSRQSLLCSERLHSTGCPE